MSPSDSPTAGSSAFSTSDTPATRRKVGLSDAGVATDGETLVTSGLGSCLGIALYDPTTGVGGLLHAMLPAAEGRGGLDQKYVVEGIDTLVADLDDAGADPTELRAKLAGAAEMIEFDMGSDTDSVGARNVDAAETALAHRQIQIVDSDTGGSRGRSLRFDTDTGALSVSYAGGETTVL